MTYETGNKDLKPELVDKVELSYSLILKKVSLRANVYYSHTRDFITQVSLLNNPEALIITYVNGTRMRRTGSDLDLTWRVAPFLSLQPALSLYYANASGTYGTLDLGVKDVSWSTNMRINIKPEKKTDFDIFINYNSPTTLPQFEVAQIYYADLSLKRTFIENKITLSLSLTDIFNTRTWKVQTNNKAYSITNHSKIPTRILWIGFSYNFNAFKAKRTQPGDEEERGSIIRLGQSK